MSVAWRSIRLPSRVRPSGRSSGSEADAVSLGPCSLETFSERGLRLPLAQTPPTFVGDPTPLYTNGDWPNGLASGSISHPRPRSIGGAFRRAPLGPAPYLLACIALQFSVLIGGWMVVAFA
eukprot:scaffold36827_cov66-Phaeocystis_antarctica.AAC.2